MSKRVIPLKERNLFRSIVTKLMKATSDAKIVKIVQQANSFLNEHDVSWDAVTVRIDKDYVMLSERHRKRTARPTLSAAVQAAHALNGEGKLGYDGRGLLKRAVVRHPEWPVVREALAVDLSKITMYDLIAIGQILKIDEQFLKLFVGSNEPAQQELPFKAAKTKKVTDEDLPMPDDYDIGISKLPH